MGNAGGLQLRMDTGTSSQQEQQEPAGSIITSKFFSAHEQVEAFYWALAK